MEAAVALKNQALAAEEAPRQQQVSMPVCRQVPPQEV
jgi:hypothetical protein